jgi:hypothetical protein
VSWLVFSYSLPAGGSSSPRVTIWRRLNRLGAISPSGGAYILPDQEDCLESLQWLAKEVQQQKGDCLLMKVESFEGLTNKQLIALFREDADKRYSELEQPLDELGRTVSKQTVSERHSKIQGEIEKLRKKHAEIVRTDFFDASGGVRIAKRLAELERSLVKREEPVSTIVKVSKKQFQNKVWVTRPRPHVDRLACAWLIRRYLDPKAKIRYSTEPSKNEISFDMKEGSTFGHVGNFCSFETMLAAFDLHEAGLATLAEIIHEIDLRDGRYHHPQMEGIDSVLKGWQLKGFTDAELELHGIALFDGLHADILRKETHAKGQHKRQ